MVTRPKITSDITGQSTIEFALITFGFLSLVIAVSVLWHAFADGLFVEHALSSASHHLSGISLGVVGDVFLY